MYSVPHTASSQRSRSSWRYRWTYGLSMLGMLMTLLWYGGLPLGGPDAQHLVGGVWRVVQPVEDWVLSRVSEVLIELAGVLVMLYGHGKHWPGRWLVLSAMPMVLLWGWWGIVLMQNPP